MTVWKFIPLLPEGDPDWLGHPRWEEVVVRAPSVGDALETAERELEPRDDSVGNESAGGSAGLSNKRLYQVVEVDAPDVMDGPSEVLKATRGSDGAGGTYRGGGSLT